MICPTCADRDTRVIDSRVDKDGRSIRRRRQCAECDFRFSTIEEVVREDLFIIKRDQRREAFDQTKIIRGIQRACEKRPIDHEQIDMLVSDIMMALESEFDNDIPSRAIGEQIMDKLKNIDPIAYVRFASVYKDFRDISEMEKEISDLKTGEDE
jgi:transcriptional repressor NrdR